VNENSSLSSPRVGGTEGGGEGLGERSKPSVLGTSAAQLLQTLAGSTFTRTQGTRFLGEEVAKLLGVSPYLDQHALASHLTTCQSPEVLLIATHGLFSREIQRQDYVNLIVAMLQCPDGEKAELLWKNRHLLNQTLLEEMEIVATIFAEKGNQNTADWLRNLAAQLATLIESPQETPIHNPPNSPYQGGNFNSPNREGNSKLPVPIARVNHKKAIGQFFYPMTFFH
jgi:hypothetical protein